MAGMNFQTRSGKLEAELLEVMIFKTRVQKQWETGCLQKEVYGKNCEKGS